MKLPCHAGYVIAPLHLAAGSLFALLPSSPYAAGYGAILVVLGVAVVAYGWIATAQRLGAGTMALHLVSAAAAALAPFFLVDFSDPWHAIVYLPIMGGSLLACLIAAALGRAFSRG